MASRMRQAVPAFLPAALVASNVGAWERDLRTKLVRCDPTMAALYGFSDEEGAKGIPLKSIIRLIVPEDRAVFNSKLAHASLRGGLSVVEYRIEPLPGLIRWMLVRGRYETDSAGVVVRGHGIVIDITESKLDGDVEERAFHLASRESGGSALERAADHALSTRYAIDEHDPHGTSLLRSSVDELLWALGRALAAEMSNEGEQIEPVSDRSKQPRH